MAAVLCRWPQCSAGAAQLLLMAPRPWLSKAPVGIQHPCGARPSQGGECWGQRNVLEEGRCCPSSQSSVAWSCWRGHRASVTRRGWRRGGNARDLPHTWGCCSVLGFPPSASPEPSLDVGPGSGCVPATLCPAGRQECAGRDSLPRWPRVGPAWHPSHPGHAGNAACVGTALSTRSVGLGTGCQGASPSLLQRCFGGASPSLLPAMLWGCIPHLVPSDASPSSLSSLPDADHLPAPGEGSGPLGGPLPLPPAPRGAGMPAPGKPCRARVAWELGNLIPGNGAEGRGHSRAAAGPRPPLSPHSHGAAAPPPTAPQERRLGVWGGLLALCRTIPGDAVTGSCRLLRLVTSPRGSVSPPGQQPQWAGEGPGHWDQLLLRASSWASRPAAGTVRWQFQECWGPVCRSHPPLPSLPAVTIPIVHLRAWQLRAGCPEHAGSPLWPWVAGGKLRHWAEVAVGTVGRGPPCSASWCPAALHMQAHVSSSVGSHQSLPAHAEVPRPPV